MWRPFWQNPFFKIVNFFLLFYSSFLLQKGALSNESASIPGIIESISKLEEIHQNRFKKLKVKIDSNPQVISSLDNIQNVKLNREYLLNVLFKSTTKYYPLIKNNPCHFYTILSGPSFRTTYGNVDSLIIDYQKKNNELDTAIVTKDDFLNKIYEKDCINNKEIASLFGPKSLKSTIQSIHFTIPQTRGECEVIYQDWIKNPYTPHLCQIDEEIQRGSRAGRILNARDNLSLTKEKTLLHLSRKASQIKKSVPFFERTYIFNLCKNLSHAKYFCETYLTDDLWSKILHGEKEKYLMESRCLNYLGIENIKKDHYSKCASDFNKDPKICTRKGKNNFPALFPYPNCQQISKALNNSNLKTDYRDCPGNIDNESISNIYRIISHVRSKKEAQSHNFCASKTNHSFMELNTEAKNKKVQHLKICFPNRLTDKKECLPYIPGNVKGSKIEEHIVVAKAIYKMIGGDSKLKCRVVNSKIYNPTRLEFSVGCFIVYDDDLCTPFHCPKKIILDKKEVKNIEYVGMPIFDYFPNSYIKENFSMFKIMENVLKVKNISLRNLTELRAFLKKKKTNIAHGMGCAEELLPHFFTKSSFNKCTPLSFIIDGSVNEKNNSYLVLRTAIDDIHSPRLVPWNFIFSSLLTYQKHHPLSLWTLYGIR